VFHWEMMGRGMPILTCYRPSTHMMCLKIHVTSVFSADHRYDIGVSVILSGFEALMFRDLFFGIWTVHISARSNTDSLYHDPVFRIISYRQICSCIEKCNLGSWFANVDEISVIDELNIYRD